jgi:hypothetical protein
MLLGGDLNGDGIVNVSDVLAFRSCESALPDRHYGYTYVACSPSGIPSFQ